MNWQRIMPNGKPLPAMAQPPVHVWWTPGEPEDDLHGFVTRRDRDDGAAGKSGPFLRVVRDHHTLGRLPDEVVIIRNTYLTKRRNLP